MRNFSSSHFSSVTLGLETSLSFILSALHSRFDHVRGDSNRLTCIFLVDRLKDSIVHTYAYKPKNVGHLATIAVMI